MNSNSDNQRAITEPKWQAIASLILGIISILPGVSVLISLGTSWQLVAKIIAYLGLSFIGYWIWLFPAAGFILGIIGLKYTKKKLAIAGIVLSLIGFMVYTFVYTITLRMGQL